MGRGNFPLDGAFEELRQVVNETRDALVGFISSLGGGGGSAASRGGGGSGNASQARDEITGRFTSGTSSAAGNISATAAAVDKLNTSQERAARSGKKLSDSLKGTDTAAAGLQKSLKGAADIAEFLGFEDAEKKLNSFAKGLGGVRDLVQGLGAALPILKGVGIVAGAVGVAFGVVQEAIFQVTGKTVSLKNAAAILALSIAGPLTKALAAASGELAGFASIASKGFRIVTDATKGIVDEFKRFASVGNTIKLLPQAVKDAVPGLETLGAAMAALAPGDTVDRVAHGFIELGNAVAAAGSVGSAALKGIKSDLEALDKGIDETIDQRLNEPNQGPLLFRDPIGALKKAKEDADAAVAEAKRAFGLTAQAEPAPAERQQLGQATALDEFRAGLLEAADLTAQTFDFIESAASQFSATVSNAILDAFLDPQADIRDSFAGLFKAIAAQLLQLLIQASILRIAAGFTGVGAQNVTDASGAVVGVGTSLADGGTVKAGRSVASAAHYARGARGFSGGGRPWWVDARDTIAAWLQPNEFVQPVRAVQYYGGQFMEAVRTLSFPRELATAMSEGVSVPAPVMTAAPLSLAAGGPVGGGTTGHGGATVHPVMPATGQTFRTLLAGSEGELERWMERNQGKVRRALGV